MTCALCSGPIADLTEGVSECPHCGAVLVVVRIETPPWTEALEPEEEDA